jgi:hypothetical protein
MKKSNCVTMSSGLANIGIDTNKIELHHIAQENNGHIIELTYLEHHLPCLHDYKAKSEIDGSFDYWRRGY